MHILTHLTIESMLKKCDVSNNNSVLRAREKCVLADVVFYWNMMSLMALGGVTSFLRLKDITNTGKLL